MKRLALLCALLTLAAPASAAAPRILPARDFDPVWSPDRTHVAFARGTSSGQGLEILDVPTARVVEVARNAYGLKPSWSPRGGELAYQAGGAIWTGTVGSHRSFSPTRRTGAGQRAFAPRWNPNPRGADSIAYLTTLGARNTDLWLMVLAADGLERKRLVRDAVGSPAWSPDGEHVGFQRDNGIFDVDVAMGGERRLAAVANPGPPAFSHDGARVAYAAAGRVWVVASDGSEEPVAVSPPFREIGPPSWTAADDALVYARAGGVEQTVLGGSSRLLAAASFGDGLVALRPGSSDIAYAGPRLSCQGHTAIRLLQLERSPRTLTGSCAVRGTARADAIEGSIGAGDVVLAGGGNDTIHANDRHADRVDCGPGRDVVYADRSDRLRGCEIVHR